LRIPTIATSRSSASRPVWRGCVTAPLDAVS